MNGLRSREIGSRGPRRLPRPGGCLRLAPRPWGWRVSGCPKPLILRLIRDIHPRDQARPRALAPCRSGLAGGAEVPCCRAASATPQNTSASFCFTSRKFPGNRRRSRHGSTRGTELSTCLETSWGAARLVIVKGSETAVLNDWRPTKKRVKHSKSGTPVRYSTYDPIDWVGCHRCVKDALEIRRAPCLVSEPHNDASPSMSTDEALTTFLSNDTGGQF